MSTLPVQRLDERSLAALHGHFLALTLDDRRLRFGSSLSADAIASYVDGIDFDRDAVFAVHDDNLALVGVAHLALGPDHAELGLSVLPAHRGRGVGTALFGRGAEHARNRFASTLFMHCLRENAAIVHIARRAGMHIVTEAGDSDARVLLPPASAGSFAEELVADRVALYDYALKAQVAAWRGVNAVLEQASRHTR
jgi:GNAT superfamily N-acetyltransferase